MPFNVPNVLTVIRICMVPVMVLLLLGDDAAPMYLAAAVFGAAALTDIADGHLARARDDITTFGRLMDPLADKLLVGAALASLVAVDRLALWIAAAIVLRELAVSGLRWHAGSRGIVIAVSGLGKLKTGLQMTAIPMLMLVPSPGALWVEAWLAGVVAVTVASGVDYALGYARSAADAPPGVQVARW